MTTTFSVTSVGNYQISEEILWSVEWRPNKNELVCSGADRKLYMVKFDENYQLVSIKNFVTESLRTIRSVAWSPCGRLLATCSFDSISRVYTVDADLQIELVSEIEGHDSEVKSIAWDSNGLFLATCGRDCTVWVWEFLPPNEFQCATVVHQHSLDVKKVKFSHGGNLLVSCGYDSQIIFYEQDEEEEWTMTDSYKIGQTTVWSVSFSPDDRYLAACTADSRIYIFDVELVKKYCHLVNPDSAPDSNAFIYEMQSTQCLDLMDISWSDGGRYLATSSRNDGIHIFEMTRNGNVFLNLKQVVHVGSEVNSISWRGSTHLACVNDSGCLDLYRVDEE
ncbi:putative cytosolic iron-sulfur protein assembly protein CIAO1 [Thelohanellus kitauei]|uniref:Putative cytosolic iron-sulfur protein assembly protein CIAO1 n=1 Tax=Thelohanellus kitauei TaxID=669202 RepID=A0A0C2IJB7_THEKT|nr:putative cytosolic iron-sulfur protein assembly protein CIAO1 [Thelohanellus kitauei]